MDSFQLCCWYRKLSCFSKLCNSEHAHYLFKLISSRSPGYVSRNRHNIPFFETKHTFLKTHSSRRLWLNGINLIINASSFNSFRKSVVKFIRPSDNSFFNSHNPKGIKFIIRLRRGLNQLQEHKCKRSFQDSLNPFSNYVLNIESTAHYLLHCPTYITERRAFLSTIKNIYNNLVDLSEPVLIKTILFGSNLFNTNGNTMLSIPLLNMFYLKKEIPLLGPILF